MSGELLTSRHDAKPYSARLSPARFGAWLAVVTLVLDQLSKLSLLFVFDIAAIEPVQVLPIFDLVLVWNQGISYGLFQQESGFGRWFLVILSLAVTLVLAVWMTRCRHHLLGVALGLLVGGALGNAIDRAAYGAVMDFAHFHWGRFSWYVFNVADVAIVVGVALLLYDSFFGEGQSSEVGSESDHKTTEIR